MGIVNVTPDSFSDGGRFLEADAAISHALRLHAEGADLVDVGGESTRPGAEEVAVDDELRRVMPVLEALVQAGVPVSVDTSKPRVMREAIAAGCAVVNDVNAFRAPGALEAVVGANVDLVAMHMQGTPRTMQANPHYEDAPREVAQALLGRAGELEAAGVARGRIALDPGFGFGKTFEHNRQLFRALPELASHGYPLVVGVSRKRMIGELTGGRPTSERIIGSVAAAMLAAQNGASVLRVHDVRETLDALNTWMGLRP